MGTAAVAVRFRNDVHDTLVESAADTVQRGDHVVVNTERGRMVALANGELVEVDDALLESARKNKMVIERVATDEDLALADEMSEKGAVALSTFRELITKHDLDMKPVRVEFMLDGNKAVFYFASDGRVDFRELVRDLASTFHCRVDMRQIGVRDEARCIGGLSHCGQELCCVRMGGEFKPVSIRMAKEQDLSLNPLKISGLCGRLMCCLRYEFDAYKDFHGRAPKKGALIETPLGLAKVTELDTPREIIKIRFEDGKSASIPLGEMTCSKKSEDGSCPCRPDSVSAEVLEAAMRTHSTISGGVSGVERKLEDGVVETDPKMRVGKSARNGSRSDDGAGNGSQKPRRRRRSGSGKPPSAQGQARSGQGQRGSGQGSGERRGRGQNTPDAASGKSASGNRQQRRRSEHGGSRQGPADSTRNAGSGTSRNGTSRPRPGQNSSSIRGNADASASGTNRGAGQPRRKPRRRHPAGEGGSQSSPQTKE